jgi:RNA polymerase sigma-70 factor (ECF subfamily)
MADEDWLAARFEKQRNHLKAVAYRMLGSLAESEDAVQEAWLRVSKAGTDGVENLEGWLTTIVARICLNVLRARRTSARVPDPVIEDASNPERETLLADSVGLALLVVLDTLDPAERLAFVLHDMFDLSFDEIGRLVERTPTAARQLASRARRRVRGAALPDADRDLERQREVVDAFFAAARGKSFDALVALLDPDVVLRSDGGAARPEATMELRGPETIARHVMRTANPQSILHPVLVNGVAGVVASFGGQPFTVIGFTIRGGKIVEIHAIADPARVQSLAK